MPAGLFKSLLSRAESRSLSPSPSSSHFFHYQPPPPVTQARAIEHAIINEGLIVTAQVHVHSRPPRRSRARRPQSVPEPVHTNSAPKQELSRRYAFEDALQISRKRPPKPVNEGDAEISSPFRRGGISPVRERLESPVILRRRPRTQPSFRIPDVPASPERKVGRVSKTVGSPDRWEERSASGRVRGVDCQLGEGVETDGRALRERNRDRRRDEDAQGGRERGSSEVEMGSRGSGAKSKCGSAGLSEYAEPKRSSRLKMLADRKGSAEISSDTVRLPRRRRGTARAGGPESDVSTDGALTIEKATGTVHLAQTAREKTSSVIQASKGPGRDTQKKRGDQVTRYRRLQFSSDSDSDQPSSVIDLTDEIEPLGRTERIVLHTKSPITKTASARVNKRKLSSPESGGRRKAASKACDPTSVSKTKGSLKSCASGGRHPPVRGLTGQSIDETLMRRRLSSRATRNEGQQSIPVDDDSSVQEVTTGVTWSSQKRRHISDNCGADIDRENTSQAAACVVDDLDLLDDEPLIKMAGYMTRSSSRNRKPRKLSTPTKKFRTEGLFRKGAQGSSPSKRKLRMESNQKVISPVQTSVLEIHSAEVKADPEAQTMDEVEVVALGGPLSRLPSRTKGRGRQQGFKNFKSEARLKTSTGISKSKTSPAKKSSTVGSRRGKKSARHIPQDDVVDLDEVSVLGKATNEYSREEICGPMFESVGCDDVSIVQPVRSKRLQYTKSEDVLERLSSLHADGGRRVYPKLSQSRKPAADELASDNKLPCERSRSKPIDANNPKTVRSNRDSRTANTRLYRRSLPFEPPLLSPDRVRRKRERHSSPRASLHLEDMQRKVQRRLVPPSAVNNGEMEDYRKQVALWMLHGRRSPKLNENDQRVRPFAAQFPGPGTGVEGKSELHSWTKKSSPSANQTFRAEALPKPTRLERRLTFNPNNSLDLKKESSKEHRLSNRSYPYYECASGSVAPHSVPKSQVPGEAKSSSAACQLPRGAAVARFAAPQREYKGRHSSRQDGKSDEANAKKSLHIENELPITEGGASTSVQAYRPPGFLVNTKPFQPPAVSRKPRTWSSFQPTSRARGGRRRVLNRATSVVSYPSNDRDNRINSNAQSLSRDLDACGVSTAEPINLLQGNSKEERPNTEMQASKRLQTEYAGSNMNLKRGPNDADAELVKLSGKAKSGGPEALGKLLSTKDRRKGTPQDVEINDAASLLQRESRNSISHHRQILHDSARSSPLEQCLFDRESSILVSKTTPNTNSKRDDEGQLRNQQKRAWSTDAQFPLSSSTKIVDANEVNGKHLDASKAEEMRFRRGTESNIMICPPSEVVDVVGAVVDSIGSNIALARSPKKSPRKSIQGSPNRQSSLQSSGGCAVELTTTEKRCVKGSR